MVPRHMKNQIIQKAGTLPTGNWLGDTGAPLVGTEELHYCP